MSTNVQLAMLLITRLGSFNQSDRSRGISTAMLNWLPGSYLSFCTGKNNADDAELGRSLTRIEGVDLISNWINDLDGGC